MTDEVSFNASDVAEQRRVQLLDLDAKRNALLFRARSPDATIEEVNSGLAEIDAQIATLLALMDTE